MEQKIKYLNFLLENEKKEKAEFLADWERLGSLRQLLKENIKIKKEKTKEFNNTIRNLKEQIKKINV